MQGEKSKCSLDFYVILSVTIEKICKQIIPAAKFAIWLAIENLRKLLDMRSVCMVGLDNQTAPFSRTS